MNEESTAKKATPEREKDSAPEHSELQKVIVRSSSNPALFVLGALLIALICFVAGVVVAPHLPFQLTRRAAPPPESQSMPLDGLSEQTQDTTQPSTPSDMTERFTDPRLAGMSFSYDPNEWRLTESPLPNGKTLTLQNLDDDGELTISYALPFGREGAVRLLRRGEVTNLHNGLARHQVGAGSAAEYTYGLVVAPGGNETVTYFDQNPDAKQPLVDTCDPNYDGMTIFDPVNCAALLADEYVGYAQEPSFSWGLTLPSTASLGEIDPEWGTAETQNYFASFMDEQPQVILLIQYRGPDPRSADPIVLQLPVVDKPQ